MERKIKGQTIIFFLILMLAINPVFAATIQDNTYTRVNPNIEVFNLTDIKTTVLTDGIKTRAEITNYMDRKYDQQMTSFRTDFSRYIDDNFRVIDAKVHFLVIKSALMIAVIIGTSILLSCSIWYLIYKRILKKEEKKPRYLLLDEFTAQKYGLATQEHMERIERNNLIGNEKQQPKDISQIKSPPPPTIKEIEKKFETMKEARERKKAEKEELEKQKKIKRMEAQEARIKQKLKELKPQEEPKIITPEPKPKKLFGIIPRRTKTKEMN